MSLKSDLTVIGPFETLYNCEVLDYPRSMYDELINPNLITFGTIVIAETSEQSRKLADICGISVWNFSEHQIKIPLLFTWDYDEYVIGDMSAFEIIKKVNDLLRDERVMIFFRPNG